MKKRALLAVLMAMTLLLSSCALIVKDEAVDAATVILKMGDTEVTKAEVQDVAQNLLDQYASMYGSSVDITSADIISSAQSSAVTQLKEDMVLRAKAKELGLDQLTEEETAEAKQLAQENLDYSISYIKANYLADSGLEGEDLDKAVQEKLTEFGVSLETYEKTAMDQKLDDKLKDYIVKDVTVPDEDVQADFDSKVASDKQKYENDAASWTTAANGTSGTTLYYTPAGIRRVKQILIKFLDADQTAIDEAKSRVTAATSKVTAAQELLDAEDATEEEKDQAQKDLDAANAELAEAQKALDEATAAGFANLDAEADAVLAELEADPDSWDKLLEEKNQDPGMQSGTTAEKGYAISADMTSFDSAFVEAAMALKSVGDISPKVKGSSYGYYIIKYIGDEPEGPIDIETVKEDLRSSLLSTKQNTVYNQQVEQWVDDAGIVEDLGALNN